MIEELHQLSIFDGLDEGALEEIAELCSIRVCAAGEALLEQHAENEADRDLYLLINGLVDVVVRLPEESEPHEVRLENLDYELLGEIAWLHGGRRSATVTCNRPTEAIRLNGPAFMEYLERNREVGFIVLKRMMEIMSRKLQDNNLLLFF
ncbi:cyclic nucleotide-binding domain-containing protein [Endothiovibrio diazotrophicus]